MHLSLHIIRYSLVKKTILVPSNKHTNYKLRDVIMTMMIGDRFEKHLANCVNGLRLGYRDQFKVNYSRHLLWWLTNDGL